MAAIQGLRVHTCTVIRRKLVKFGHLGPDGPVWEGEEWRIEPCATPLFTDVEQTSGRCRSCVSGWRTDNNYPVDPHGKEL
jgi:hypothetical protein